MTMDVGEFVRWAGEDYLPRCRVDGRPGRYGRRPGREDSHVYGVAEAANIAYTLGLEIEAPEELAAAFEELQDPGSGHYLERPPTHDALHATAYCLAAMWLYQLSPRHPVRFAEEYRSPESVEVFMADLDWYDDVYMGSHRGAGLGAVMALVPDPPDRSWFEAYFDALERRLDERSGLHGFAKPDGGDSDQIGGTFHYAFLHDHFGRPLPHPEARIDSVLGCRRPSGWWHPENRIWLTFDAVYLLSRASARTGHRRAEAEDVIEQTTRLVADTFCSPDGRRHFEDWYLGAHDLTAVLSLLAEVQTFTGGESGLLRAGKCLRLVLDERPFI